MASEWREVRLEDIAARSRNALVGGPFGSDLVSSDYVPSGVPVIRGENVSLGRWVAGDFVFVSAEKAVRLAANTAGPLDLVFTQRGANHYRQVALVPANAPERFLISQSQMKLTVDPGTVDPLFVYYLMRAPEQQAYLQRNAIQTGVPHTNLSILRRMPIRIPSLSQQRRIAAELGALDDKIELNRRMSRTLESMARALFKSWFVDFDPVRAKAEGRDPGLPSQFGNLFPESFQDSEIGEIPRGWRVGRLAEKLAELVSGARPKGGSTSSGVPSIGAENVIGLGRYDYAAEKYVPEDFFLTLERKGASIQDGDVLLYKDGAQVGRKTYFESGFPHLRCSVNEHVFVVRATRREEQRFLFFWLDQDWMTQEIVNLNSNSAQPGINQVGVRGLTLLIPPDAVVNAFDQVAAGVTRRLFESRTQSIALAAMRDVLLPQFLSGAIRVPPKMRSGAA